MVKYTNLGVLKAKMASLETIDKEIVISVIKNLVCYLVIGAMNNDDAYKLKINI